MAEGLLKVEEWLTESLKWTVRGLQLSGYFPFSIRNGKLEVGRFSAVLLLWTTLLIVLTFAHVFTFITGIEDFLGGLMYREVEKLTVRALALVMGLVSVTMKIFPLIYRKNLMHFWTENCQLLEFMACRGSDNFKLQEILDDLAKRSKRLIFALVAAVPVIFLTLNMHRAPKLFFFLQTRWDCFLKVMGNYFFWMFLSLIDGFFWFWISYFLRLYASVFLKLSEKLQNTNKAITLRSSYYEHLKPVVAVQRSLCHSDYRDLEMDLAHILESLSRVEKSITNLNTLFGNVVVIEVGLAVTYVLVYSFAGICALLGGNLTFAFGLALWSVLFASKLFVIGTDSSNLSTAAINMATELLVSARGKAYYGKELSQHAYMVAMRVMIRPPQHAPGNFFNLDRNLLVAIFSTITTYLIILIQFRQAEKLSS